MVNIVINNDIKIPLVGNYNPINFEYRLFEKRISKYEGELSFREINIPGNLEIDRIATIELVGETQRVLISNFNSVYFEINREFSFVNITLRYNDIFTIFERLTFFFNIEFEPSSLSYDCFSTSMSCNLSCEYCVSNCNIKKKHMYYPIEIANYFIKKIRRTISSITKPAYKYVRVMGGETLINLEEFDDVVTYIKRSYDIIDNIWIYTNLTVNIDEFIDRVREITNYDTIKKVTIILTSDSFDENLSDRIKDKKMMNSYIENIKKVVKNFKDNKKVLIASNLMYTTYDETFKTAMKLYELGVSFVQISYDEFLDRNESLLIRNNVHDIYSKIEENNIKRLKPNLGKTMWFHFSVSVSEYDIYQCKYSFNSDYIIAELNNY